MNLFAFVKVLLEDFINLCEIYFGTKFLVNYNCFSIALPEGSPYKPIFNEK